MNLDTMLFRIQDVDEIFKYKNNKRKGYGEKIDKFEYESICIRNTNPINFFSFLE